MNMNYVRYLGLAYAVNGEPPGACDCWTLVRWFCANELGQELPRFMYDVESLTEASSRHIENELVTHLGERWERVQAPELGDLIVMTMSGLPQHCGVYLGEDNFLHSLPGRDSTVERLSRWRTHVVGYYRWLA